MAEFVVGGDDGAFAVLVKLGAAGAAEDLHDIQDAEIHQGSPLSVIDLSTLLPDSKWLQHQWRRTRGLFFFPYQFHLNMSSEMCSLIGIIVLQIHRQNNILLFV